VKRVHDVGGLFASLGNGSTVVLHSGCAEPPFLARQLAEHAAEMRGVNLVTLMPMGEAPYGAPYPTSQLDVATFFPGRGLRAALNAGRVRAMRHPLSAIPGLFDSRAMKAHALLLQVSTPDEKGQVSLGISIDYMRAVIAQSPLVIAEINPRMPRTCGNTMLPVSRIDWFVDATEAPQEVAPPPAEPVDERIARNVAGLVRDGAVLQVGVGSLPDCVMAKLGHLKHLGLHTGMVTDAVRPLIEAGVIDNSTKRSFPGVGIGMMAAGTQSFYDFLHGNRAIEFHPCSVTHNAKVLAGVDGLCAINSALQVDLEGNVNAESIGGRRISLPGGLPDFAAGARRAPGGISIVALRSTFGRQRTSNIVPRLDPGCEPTIGPEAVDFIVTEHGVAAIQGLSARQRAAALIAVAHPEHREALERECARGSDVGPRRVITDSAGSSHP
jgi:4-hydroxybutyrate CoA-transferase